MPDACTALLAPRSVALVGASDDASRPSGRPLRYLRRDGWNGRVYPVNPRRSEVQGEPAWASLSALPEVPDQVFVLTPTETVVEVVADAARLGVPVVTVLAGGFAEAGDAGAARLAELRAITAGGGTRVFGPNAIGVVDTRTGMTLTANAAFVDGDLPRGTTFVASQSGSLIGALVSRGRARGIGFAALAAPGSEIDLTIGEVCAATLDDPGIETYVLFLEHLAHAESLRAFALAAAARGRPVLAYKLGRSGAGADLAVTHTGALAGDDAVASAFFADCGIARLETLEGLLEGTVLAPHAPIRRDAGPARVGVVTATGGGAAMVVDQLGLRGLEVVEPTAATLERLVAAVGFDVPSARIVDLTLRGTGVEPMGAAIDALRGSGEIDLLVQVLGSSAASQPEIAVAPAVLRRDGGVPIAVFTVPEAPDALANLARAGVAAFRTPEACADAVAALLRRRPPRTLSPRPDPVAGEPRTLDESEGYELLESVGVAVTPTVVCGRTAPADLPFDFPVVVKALIPGLAHKSDAGAVAVGLDDAAALDAAMADMAGRLGAERFVVQPRLDALAEVLVGFRRDPQVGPIVLVAAGGVLAELGTARSIRLAPVDLPTALAMIDELPVVDSLVGGYRGRPPGDRGALAAAIAALSSLASRPDVLEAEVNPLLVTVDAAVAVDALVRLV